MSQHFRTARQFLSSTRVAIPMLAGAFWLLSCGSSDGDGSTSDANPDGIAGADAGAGGGGLVVAGGPSAGRSGQLGAGGDSEARGGEPSVGAGGSSGEDGVLDPIGTAGSVAGGTGGAALGSGGGRSGSGGRGGGGGVSAGGAGSGGLGGSAGAVDNTPGIVVATNRNDNVRSSVNSQETVLTSANVAPATFGLVFSRAVDAQIYAQPLYLGKQKFANGEVHNVVFAATAQNSVYAFDADVATAQTPLWKKTLGESGQTSGFSCTDMLPQVGITATPVIDAAAGNLYVVTKGQENNNWVQRVHVLDVLTGAERKGSPVVISASVNGTGDGSNGGKVSFNARTALNRPGLLLQDGVLYVAFSSHCDDGPYHGWVLSYRYDGTQLTQTHAFTVSPNGSKGGIWQGGMGLSSDGPNVYFAAGNGSTNPNSTPPDLSESVVRLRVSDFTVQDFFTPTNYSALNNADSDLSSGATLLPHNLAFTGSKDGRMYLLDRMNLGKFKAGMDAVLQTLVTPGKNNGERGHLHGGPVAYTDPVSGTERLLIWPESSPLMRFEVDAVGRKLTGLVQAPITTPGHPGAALALSMNGNKPNTAVLWASAATGTNEDGGWHMVVPGTIYAVDPSKTPPVKLWDSDGSNGRDKLGNFSKFNTPTVANGHVYVATFSGYLRAYGLLNQK